LSDKNIERATEGKFVSLLKIPGECCQRIVWNHCKKLTRTC
jgi:hypothetical protein